MATNSSAPRRVLGPGPSRSQPRRTAGVATRAECRIAPGRLPSGGGGSLPLPSGVTEAMPPDSMPAEKAPQWVRLVGARVTHVSLEPAHVVLRLATAARATNHPVGWGSLCGNSPYQFLEVSYVQRRQI